MRRAVPDTPKPTPSRPPLGARLRRHWLVLALAVACLLVELVLAGAERGLWGSPRWRVLAYVNGGFWAGLLRAGWEGNFTAQPVTMFLSHPFLHAGLSHLAMNVVALLGLGASVRARLGPGWAGSSGMAVLLAASTLGGGIGFAALGPLSQPMVGASGALFGLTGALLCWQGRADRAAGRGLWASLGLAAALMALNLVSAWMVNWQMAWEAHVGGFAGGALAALAIRPRRPGSARG